MGMFKDVRNLKKQAKEMVPPEHRGIGGGFRAMRDGIAQANQLMGGVAAEAQKAQYLMLNGRAGTARIDGIRDSGTTINENPVVDFDLHVTVDGFSPYTVTHQQTISRLTIASLQPGATVPVRIDPANAQSLIIA